MIDPVNSRYLMPIPVKNNTQYGGNLINQKYAPLDINSINIDDNIEKEYKNLFENRIELLRGRNLLPSRLNLYANNWEVIKTNEGAINALPPIIVVSSNRAEWIKERYEDVASELLKENQLNNFQDVNDIQALTWGPTLWYDPRRINNSNRHVYILVHEVEYQKYEETLNSTNMTVIGWAFTYNRKNTYVGFGASRFAAIEFCKYVFDILVDTNTNRQKAWLVDDNVVYVRGFPGFTKAESIINTNVWGLGFGGASTNSGVDEIKNLRIGTTATMNNLDQKGLLQQCVLWNIHELDLDSDSNSRYLNFSPYFISSNEDTSFSNYLQNQSQSKLRVSSEATVFKAVAQNDKENLLKPLRREALDIFYQIEKKYRVSVANSQDMELGNYIQTLGLKRPKLAQSRAVEQIMAKVVNDKTNWVPKEIFQPNGNNRQNTQPYILRRVR